MWFENDVAVIMKDYWAATKAYPNWLDLGKKLGF